MSYVGKITDTSGNTGLVGSTLYGTCSTAAGTAAKVVTCANFDKLIDGVTIHVKFTYSNTSTGTLTLNVNSTGAKNIYKYGTTKPGNTEATSWYAGSVVSFTYDGSYWQMNDYSDDNKVELTYSASDTTARPLIVAPGITLDRETDLMCLRSIRAYSLGGYNSDATIAISSDANSSGNYSTWSESELQLLHRDSSTSEDSILGVTYNDITLSGTGNTWDGNHTSLKGALTPQVVTNSTVNLNNYTSSGKYILTGGITTKTNFPVAQPGYLEVTRWAESSTSHYCRQDFKMYNTGVWMDETYSRIGTSTNGGSTWTWNRWYSQTHFLPGESYTLNSGIITSGYVTSSSTQLFTTIWTPKSMEHTNGLSSKPSTVKLTVRGGNGQYLQASNSGYSFKWSDHYRIQPNCLTIIFTKSDSSAFSNCVNNDPYAIQFSADATITFS